MRNENNEFEYCCGKQNKVNYDIKHNPAPIKLLPEIRDSIENLLWYVPGIDSVQSVNRPLIDNPLYSQAIFDFILENINISRSRDVKIGEFKNIDIDNSYYNNEICTSCQKMILTKYNGETEVRTMLRHIRNAIAHGSFAVFNDLLFFKDTKINNNIRCTTAIIKINIIALNLALKLIIDSNGITQDNLISRAFQYLGFEVQRQVLIGKYRPDMIITKDGLKYAIEIKINKIKKIGYNDPLIDREIEALSLFKNEKITPVLIYDQMYASEKAKNRIKNEGIILLDKTEIAKLVEGTFL